MWNWAAFNLSCAIACVFEAVPRLLDLPHSPINQINLFSLLVASVFLLLKSSISKSYLLAFSEERVQEGSKGIKGSTFEARPSVSHRLDLLLVVTDSCGIK